MCADAPLIIGGGPAGSAAAITLARAGHDPILIERTSHPTDKVCGDFLSTDTIQLLSLLGIDPAALGAAAIDRVRLIHREREAEASLPFPALSLSRRTLDSALLSQAQACGADVRTGQAVRYLVPDARPCEAGQREIDWPRSGRWAVQTSEQVLMAATIFLATGKHDLRDLPRPGAVNGAVGMKMYFTLQAGSARTLERTTELTLFPGGYAGMQPVENGQAVLCIAVRKRAFQLYGGNWAGLLAAIGQHSRRFASMLSGASPSLPRPLAVAAIPYGYRTATTSAATLFRLGDQAAVIPSLTGDGMAIALHSGKLAAETWMAGFDAFAYQRNLGRTLAPQMRLAGVLHQACMSGPVQSTAVRIAAMFPALLRPAALHTRLPLHARPSLVVAQPT